MQLPSVSDKRAHAKKVNARAENFIFLFKDNLKYKFRRPLWSSASGLLS